jgi:hypothetical protein
MAEIFLVGDRGYGRVNRPVGASPRSVIKKMFVLNLLRRRLLLWALNVHGAVIRETRRVVIA